MALADVAHGRILCVWLVAQVGGAEAGIVPRVRLLDAPDFEDREAGVANCYSPWRVLDLRQPAAGIVPVVDERAVGTYPVFFPGHVKDAALRVADVIIRQHLRRARRALFRPGVVRQGAGAAIDFLGEHVRPAKILPPVQQLLARPCVGISIRQEVTKIVRVHRRSHPDLPHVGQAGRLLRLRLRPGQRGQKQRGEDGNNRDNDQQFDEREAVG